MPSRTSRTDGAALGTVVAATSAMVLLVLDSSIVGVMLPSIRESLALGAGTQAWVVAIYLLTIVVLLPVGGRLTDAWGAGRAFAVGLLGFGVASLGIGLSGSGAEIVAWRGLAGCAAALLMPAGLALVTEVVPADRRASALALYTGVGQGFATVGPLIGGACAQYLGWRWGFLINVPVVAVGLGLLAVARPVTPRHPSRVLVDLSLFRIGRFRTAVAVLFALGFGMTVATVYGAASLQDALRLSPTLAGAALLPLVLPLLLATRWAAASYERVGPRALGLRGSLAMAAGLLCAAAGLALGSVAVVVIGLVPVGVGIGLLLSPMTTAALSATPADRRGVASGLVSAVRQVGGLAGVAALGALTTLSGGGWPVALGFVVGALLCALGAWIAARSSP
jgi:MFS transporter, DHA2 family, methylenomycin A resistance protein